MQAPYKPQNSNDGIYAHGSNPLPGFKTLDIGYSRPGGPTKDAPMYSGAIFTRKTVPGYPVPTWDDHELHETQKALERRVSKGKSKSVDYDHRDMNGAGKRDEVDRFIKAENKKYPGYVYKICLLRLKEGRDPQQKRICIQMTVILQRQPAYKAKPKSKSEHLKPDLRGASSWSPIKNHIQPSYGDEDLKGHPAITGIQHRPHDQHDRFQNMPNHAPEHYIPPPPPPPAYSGLQFQPSPHAHPEKDPEFQMPHHEGERFDEPAQNNRFPEPYFNNAGPPMQNHQVSFEDQHNHGGLGHHPNIQGSHHTSRPRSGAGHHPIIQEVDPRLHGGLGHPNIQDKYNPRPRSGAGYHANMQCENNNPRPRSGAGHHPIIQEVDPRPHSGAGHPNFQDEYSPRPSSGAGHHPNMQGENINPRPVNRAGGGFDSRDHHQAHPHGGTGDCFDSRDRHQTNPHGGAGERFDVNGEFLNRPRGGGGPHIEDFQGNQPHLHTQSKNENRSGDTRDGVYGAGRTPERKFNRDSGFFSGESSDGGRSNPRDDQYFPSAYAESPGKNSYSRDHQDGHQKDNYQRRDRSNDRDSDSNKKYRKNHPREPINHNFHKTGSHQRRSSAHDQYESDHNGRNVSYNNNRQNRRTSTMDEEYGEMHSNEYLTPGDDSSDWDSGADSFNGSRGLGSPRRFRRLKRMPYGRIDDPRDRLNILDERNPEWKRREAKKLRDERQRQAGKLRPDREREETRNGRGGKGRQSSGETLPRSRLTTHRQSGYY